MKVRNSFVTVFIKKLSIELTKLSSEISNTMKEEIQKLPDSGSYDSVGATEWRKDVMNNINFAIVDETMTLVREIGLVGVDALTINRGLLINYGMGETLDVSNQYLQEYMATKMYDSKRQGFKVYTRPDEYVYDYETGTYYKSTADTRQEIPYFHQNPAHFFENGIIELRQRLELVIDNVINQIDISSFVL
jgi:hypothetical protein